MHQPGNNKVSRYIYGLCVIMLCYASFFFYPRWQQHSTEATLSWDVSGYYWYLPSVFIYKDLKHQSFKDSIFKKYNPTNGEFQQGMLSDNGNYVMKYSSGMAVMYFPFFTAAHLVARALGYPRDGFSLPYQFAIQFGGLLVAILGLWYLRKLLLLFYRDTVVGIVLLMLVIGSNYLNYTAIDCGMSHSWLFTVYVFLLLNTHYFYQSFKLKYAIRIGLLTGLAALTRPTDVISCLIPLLWGMESLSIAAIKTQAGIFLKNRKALLIAFVCAASVYSIQLIYWKYVSGHWLVYSYQDQKIDFKSPHFYNYTLSYRCGWLIYSPTMIFAFIGIIPFLRNGKNKVAILTFFLLNYYIVCAWSIWWYGGRAMVQSYPVLLFCIAALVQAVMDKKLRLWLFTPVALLFIYMNIWITYNYHGGGLYDNDCMTNAYFWRVVGRWKVPANISELSTLKDNHDLFEGTPADVRLVYQNSFGDDTGSQYILHTKDNGKSLLLNKEYQDSHEYKFAFSDRSNKWMRVQANFRCDDKEYNVWNMMQFIVKMTYKGKDVKHNNMLRVYRLLGDHESKAISLDVKLPKVAYDSVSVRFWNANSDKPIWIDNLKASTFN